MGFASDYLEKRALFPELIKEAPSEDTNIIVVVPSFDEPEITNLLDSLNLCAEPACRAEVLIIVNAPEGAGEKSLLNNRESILKIESWKKEHSGCFFRVFIIDLTSVKMEGWGVGMARKTGMDEALRRFSQINKPDGIILNLDADCKVKSNYFTSVYCEMNNRKDRSACSIYFEHPTSGNEFPGSVYKAIILYELHLRYYFQGLAFTGFPYVHHTIGSAIAVKALPYMKAGGMNRRLAGEDFYFIQKLVPAGGFFNLNQTIVFPSPRSSLRVPFGTGPVISRLTETDNETLLSYNFEAFKDLKILFSLIDKIFFTGYDDPEFCFNDLPPGLKEFTGVIDWTEKIREIRGNTSGIESFRKRFFGRFNMFKIVKYLNWVHISHMAKKPVIESASELLIASGMELKSMDSAKMLDYFRRLELES
jgi:hypothetical protein